MHLAEGGGAVRLPLKQAEALSKLSEETIDVIVESCSRFTSPLSHVFLSATGKAVMNADESSVLSFRRAPFLWQANAVWAEGDDIVHIGWSQESWTAMKPFFADGLTYLNFVEDEGEQRVRAAFGEEKYRRLSAVKRHVDPTNVFHLNQNIKP